MRLIGLDQITGDEVLAKTLFDIDGRRLLSSGVTLKPSIVQKLYEKHITSIYIHDEVSEGIEIGNIISDETMNCAKTVLREEMQRVSKKHELDLSAVSAVVNRIMDEMLSNRIEVLNVKDIRLEEEKTFAHSLSVCMLSIALASKLSLPVAKIKSIAMGAFLHDIGKAYLPSGIVHKYENLSKDEELEMRKHPLLGYNLIKDARDASATTKVTILMHHEHINGSGYPMALTGDKIHYSAKIVTICDEFDISINDSKLKHVLQTTDAVEYLIGASGHVFDKSFVDEFIKIIPIYPEGTIVLLSNGCLAIVIKNNPINMTRPVVRAFYNTKTKTKLNQTNIIDLREELSIKILREMQVNVREIMR